jgi:hypothetical protein
MNRYWKIKYSTRKYSKSLGVYGTYNEAMEEYNKIKWEDKCLWDITNIPELIHSNNATGNGGYITSTHELINKS